MLEYENIWVVEQVLTKTGEEFSRAFSDESIISIMGVSNDLNSKPFECERSKMFPGDMYFGVEIKTTNSVIKAYISPDYGCSEIYGAMISQDDVSFFVGAKLKTIYLTDVACNTEYVDHILSCDNDGGDYCNIQFINFETDKGVLQLTVYNCDNGYYGHDIIIQIDDNVEYENKIGGKLQ